MVITSKSGNIVTSSITGYEIDALTVEWFETNKRILHKCTHSGIPVTLKFLEESPDLKEGDILFRDDTTIIAVTVKPCQSLVITPRSTLETAGICYEIGNRHLPLFYEDHQLLVPYEVPIHNLLEAAGYELKVENRKLINAFSTTVLPHLQMTGAASYVLQNFPNKPLPE